MVVISRKGAVTVASLAVLSACIPSMESAAGSRFDNLSPRHGQFQNDPMSPEYMMGYDCDFEEECRWNFEPRERFRVSSGREVREMLKNDPSLADISGLVTDASGSPDGHFLFTVYPENTTAKHSEANTTLAVRSPLLNVTGNKCTLSVSLHSSGDYVPIRVVVQDEKHKTLVDFKRKTYVANKWFETSTQLTHHGIPFHTVLEVVPPQPSSSKKILHVAIDNIRFENCDSDERMTTRKCSPPRDFVCNNGRCLLGDHVCDFVKDCSEGEDEEEMCDDMPEDSRCDFETGLCGWTNGSSEAGIWARKEAKEIQYFHAFRQLPMYDHTLQNRSGHCMIYDEPYAGVFGASSSVMSAVFPPIPYYHAQNNSEYYRSCRVRFYYYLAGQNLGALSLHVTFMGPSNKSFEVWSHDHDTKDRWLRGTFSLPTNIGEQFRLEFLAQRGLRHNAILAVDDISLSPECFGIGVPENETRKWPALTGKEYWPSHSAREFRFTTCGAIGRFGPNQERCSSSYERSPTRVSVNHQGNFTGIQLWKTPQSGYYTRIIAKGASGGFGSGNYQAGRSRGAVVTTIVYLEADQPVHILVGQQGMDGPDVVTRNKVMTVGGNRRKLEGNETFIGGTAGGGGGGTFVFKTDGPVTKALVIAAGGGGSPLMPMLGEKAAMEPMHGKGFYEAIDPPREEPERENGAGHGGGWSGRQVRPDTAGSLMSGAYGGRPCKPMLPLTQESFVQEGFSEGGFGGGGGGCLGGGGGGGYFGGRGGDDPTDPGEGGWSFAIGMDILAEAGANDGAGSVTILPSLPGKTCGCSFECIPDPNDMTKFRCHCPPQLLLGPDGKSCIALEADVLPPLDLTLILPLCIAGIMMLCVTCALSVTIYRRYQKRRLRLMGYNARPLSAMSLNRLGGGPGSMEHPPGMTSLPPSIAAGAAAMLEANMITEYNPNYEFGGISSLHDLKTVSRDRLSLVKGLGQGAFGEVYQGYLRADDGSESAVAVKTLPELSSNQASMDFLMEALIMAQFSHPNIVQFIGVSFECSPKFIVLELLAGGDLKTFLRESRPTPERPSPLTMKDLLLCAKDVAAGCLYLEENHFIHRDIAARNCLLTTKGPGRIVKIADFGMARDIYRADYYRKGGKAMLPVKWMPPEAFLDGMFTSKTDVWSFGILLWEVMSLGYMPYPGRSNQEVMEIVSSGGRLESPPRCPPPVYRIMDQCWATESDQRPTFATILERIGYCIQDPDVTNTPLPICSAVLGTELDVTIIRPPPSQDGSLPCLSLAMSSMGRAHSLSSTSAASHRSGSSGGGGAGGGGGYRRRLDDNRRSMVATVGSGSGNGSISGRSDYMVPRNASSGALVLRASEESNSAVDFREGEIKRQRSVPYELHQEGAIGASSTERLLGETSSTGTVFRQDGGFSKISRRNGGPVHHHSSTELTASGGTSNQLSSNGDNNGSSGKHHGRSQRSHSRKERSRADRSRSRGRSNNNLPQGSSAGGAAVGNGGLRESDSSQPLLGSTNSGNQSTCEGMDSATTSENGGDTATERPPTVLNNARSSVTPSSRINNLSTGGPSSSGKYNNYVNRSFSKANNLSGAAAAVALDPANLPQSTAGVVRYTANALSSSPPPANQAVPSENKRNNVTNSSASATNSPYVVTSFTTQVGSHSSNNRQNKCPLKENEISV